MYHIESLLGLYMDSLETGEYRYHHVPIWQSERLFLSVKKRILLDMLMTLTDKNYFLYTLLILEHIHTHMYHVFCMPMLDRKPLSDWLVFRVRVSVTRQIIPRPLDQ